MEGIYSRLQAIQAELVAPKSRTNTFGKYSYRSCEDILAAVKPLLNKYGVVLTLSDDIIAVNDRIYVKATARLSVPGLYQMEENGHITELSDEKTIEVSAYAREAADKKGMDDSQITGTASSYARKYALNGLFCIDDTKDADATNTHGKDLDQVIGEAMEAAELNTPISPKELEILKNTLTDNQAEWALNAYGIGDLSAMTKAEYGALMRQINDRKNAEEKAAKKK